MTNRVKTKWRIKNTKNTGALRTLSNELPEVPEQVLGLLYNRGFKRASDIREFLEPDINSLHDPFKMKGISEAVCMIKDYMDSGKNIAIFGDFDMDGISSTSVLMLTFRRMGYDNISYYVPNRMKESYGLSKKAIDLLSMTETDLIITVDNGITCREEVEYAKSLGIEVIITDHHQVQDDKFPLDCIVVNPHQKGCKYPNKNLAGVGVAFKLACALDGSIEYDEYFFQEILNIVALGTIADIVSLTGENRVIAKYGCQNLGDSSNLGLRVLARELGVRTETLSGSDVGFKLAPVFNAVGRVGKPELGVELILSQSADEIEDIVEQMVEHNVKRKEKGNKMFEEAVEIIERDGLDEHKVIVVASRNFHSGIVGISASKIVDRYAKPTILLTVNAEGVVKGSGRSVEGVSILDLVTGCSDLLEKFGGHNSALGLLLKEENLEEFKARMIKLAEGIDDELLVKTVDVDLVLSEDDLTFGLVECLDMLEPCGKDNPSVSVMLKDTVVSDKKIIGKEKNHAKFSANNKLDVLAFNSVLEGYADGDFVDVVGSLGINEFRGNKNIQLIARDWRDAL